MFYSPQIKNKKQRFRNKTLFKIKKYRLEKNRRKGGSYGDPSTINVQNRILSSPDPSPDTSSEPERKTPRFVEKSGLGSSSR